MSERMTDEGFDLELRRFLSWQAGDVDGAPDPTDVAATLSARIGAARQSSPLAQPAGLLLLLALVTAVLLGALVASSLRRDSVLTDHAPLSLGIAAWEELVAGHDGRVWSRGEQGISVYDPATGEARVFGLADDPLFARGWIVAAAADGGIWLTDIDMGGAIRFDGTALTDAFTLPAGRICGISDGDELVGMTCDGTVLRLDGSGWTTLARSIPDRHAFGLSIDDATDTYWVIGTPGAGGPYTVWEHRAGTWTSHEMIPALARDLRGTATAPDGSVWAWGRWGVARYDGASWSTLLPREFGTGSELMSLSMAADGSVWGTTMSTAFRYEDGSLAKFSIGPGWDGGPGDPQIALSEAGVFASVGGALMQLVDDAFVVVDPGPPSTLQHIQDIAVDAEGVAWLLTGTDDAPRDLPAGVGRVVDGHYEELAQRGQAIRLGLDGRLWMATPEGPMRLEGDSFSLAGPPLRLGSAPAEGAWLELPPYAIGPDGAPYTVVRDANRDASEAIARLAHGRWQELPQFGFVGTVTAMAVAPDDVLWVAAGRPEPALLRFVEGQWSTIAVPEQIGGDIVSIVFDRNGTAWFDVGLDVTCVDHEFFGLMCKASRGVARLHDGEWTVFDDVAGQSLGTDDRHPGRRHFSDLAIGPDDTVWLATEHGIARFDGDHWGLMAEGDHRSFAAVAVGPDGSVWAGGIGIHRLQTGMDGEADD